MRILFVTASDIFDAFEKEYEVSSAGQLPSLEVATAVLGNKNITPPEAVFIGHDMSLPKVINFIREHSVQAHLTQVRWLVVTDPATHFMANELNGIAKTIKQPQVSPANLAAITGIRRTRVARTMFISAINIKGGTGKTTFLTNLADALARRLGGFRVVRSRCLRGNALQVRDSHGLRHSVAQSGSTGAKHRETTGNRVARVSVILPVAGFALGRSAEASRSAARTNVDL